MLINNPHVVEVSRCFISLVNHLQGVRMCLPGKVGGRMNPPGVGVGRCLTRLANHPSGLGGPLDRSSVGRLSSLKRANFFHLLVSS